jgi:AcrR family transcriptional regulator
MATETEQLAVPLRRGDLTRERLLDAAEMWVAEAGFDAPTHRGIGERAHVHTALVNYHFGSKEVLLEDMVERRASRLVEAWLHAIEGVRTQERYTAEDVLHAYFSPFRSIDETPAPWRKYLCVVAHLFHEKERAASRARHFGQIEREFLRALKEAAPALTDEEVAFGFHCARELLDEALFFRCGLSRERDAPPGFRPGDIDRLVSFLAAGIDALPNARPKSSADPIEVAAD